MIISMVVAMGRNGELGLDNKMLWHIKEDFRHFKETTMGHVLIMGRKTFESIGKPLPGRKTIILSRSFVFDHEDCFIVSSIDEAIALAHKMKAQKVFIAGGGEIYRQCLPMASELILSFVDYEGPADTFFPEVDWGQWQEMRRQSFSSLGKAPAWNLVEFKRLT